MNSSRNMLILIACTVSGILAGGILGKIYSDRHWRRVVPEALYEVAARKSIHTAPENIQTLLMLHHGNYNLAVSKFERQLDGDILNLYNLLKNSKQSTYEYNEIRMVIKTIAEYRKEYPYTSNVADDTSGHDQKIKEILSLFGQ